MSSDDYNDRCEIRAIIAAKDDKKKPRTNLHRGKFGIMKEKKPSNGPKRKYVKCSNCGRLCNANVLRSKGCNKCGRVEK